MVTMLGKFIFNYLLTLVALLAMAGLACTLWGSCRIEALDFITGEQEEILRALFSFVPKLLVVLFLYFLFRVAHRLLIDVLVTTALRKLGEDTRRSTVLKVLNVAWWVLFMMTALSVVVGNLSTLVASLGLIGFGLTFAMQKPITNFMGWLTIVLKGIYREGDRIQIGSIQGDVREIQTMNTVLESLLPNSDIKDLKIVTFPNELVLTSEVKNFTKEENYIKDELVIAITFESDYHRAMTILDQIVSENIRRNRANYIRDVKDKHANLASMIRKHGEDPKKPLDRARSERLRQEQQMLEDEIKHLEDLDEELKPNIRVEIGDSAILLAVQFFTPYDEIKKNRTAINLAFLDAVKFEKNIEIAYPHMEVVYNGKKGI